MGDVYGPPVNLAARFTAVAERAATLDLNSAEVKAFIELLGSEKLQEEKRQKRAEVRAKRAAETKKAIEASGADVVTVAVRRINITDRSKENLLDYLDPKKRSIANQLQIFFKDGTKTHTVKVSLDGKIQK